MLPTVQSVLESWLEEAKSTAPPVIYSARRHEPRFEWHSPLEMRVGGETHYVQTRDISQNGIGITARMSFDEGTPVQIRREPNDPWIPAKVMRTTQTLGGYKVGVGFELELSL